MPEEQTCATCQRFLRYGQWCMTHEKEKQPTDTCWYWEKRWLKDPR